jgi:hypothetical protein
MFRALSAWLTAFSIVAVSLSPTWIHANSISKIERQIVEKAKFEIYKDMAFVIVSKGDLEHLDDELTDHFDKMQEMVKTSSDVIIARYGGRVTARIMDQLGRQKEAVNFLEEIFPSTYENCSSFKDCNDLIADLSDLVDIAPELIVKGITENLEKSIEDVTYQLTKDDVDSYDNSFIQRILLYRLNSLKVISEFYEETQLHTEFRKGAMPRLFNKRKDYFNAQLDLLLSEYESLSQKDDLSELIKLDLLDFENVLFTAESTLNESINDFILTLSQTQLSNSSLKLYIDRMNTPKTGEFLDSIMLRIENGKETVEAAILMGIRFADIESYLPYRREWQLFVEKLSKRKDNGLGEVASKFSDSLKALVDLRENQLKDFLNEQGYDDNPVSPYRYTESIAERLIEKERYLSENFGRFESLYLLAKNITNTQNTLGLAGGAYTESSQKDLPDDRMEYLKSKLNIAHDRALVSWLVPACYARFTKGMRNYVQPARAYSVNAYTGQSVNLNHSGQNDLRNLDIFFADRKNYKLKDACNSTIEDAKSFGVFYDVNKFVFKKRIRKLWAPVVIESLIMVAMIPITVFSGGVAGVAARPVAIGGARLFTGMAIKAGIKRMTSKKILYKISSKIVGAVAGAVAFTAVQRSLLAVVTLGKIPLYEFKKTLIQNYGKDLLYGSAIFFFLPYTAAYAQSLSVRMGTNSFYTSRPMAMDLMKIGVAGGMDTVIFTSVTYIERTIDKYLYDSEDPVIRGWLDLSENIGHSATIALAFRLRRH